MRLLTLRTIIFCQILIEWMHGMHSLGQVHVLNKSLPGVLVGATSEYARGLPVGFSMHELACSRKY